MGKGNINTRKPEFQDIEIDDQPDGGANALNVNRSETLAVIPILVFSFQ